MKRIIASLSFLLLLGTNALAGVPEWARMGTKNAALDQFVKWMANAEFYQIKKMSTEDVTLASGEEGVRVRFVFDDHKGCTGRLLEAQCMPLSEPELFCVIRLTHCKNAAPETRVGIF